jgi:hypothetical protein
MNEFFIGGAIYLAIYAIFGDIGYIYDCKYRVSYSEMTYQKPYRHHAFFIYIIRE